MMLGAVIIMIVYLCYSKGKPEENICEFINRDGRIIEINCATIEKKD